MTQLPTHTDKKLGLVIDLDTCVGCQACVTACKGWNDQGYGAALSDQNPYGSDPSGTFLNRVPAIRCNLMWAQPRSSTSHDPACIAKMRLA